MRSKMCAMPIKNEQQPINEQPAATDGIFLPPDYEAQIAEDRGFYLGSELDAWLKAEPQQVACLAEQATCLA
ncbi:MAG: hypothetical protein PHU14_02895 [Methylovulum sp.]|nr:hypothetical protein [Methylovulum sp.]